MGIIQRGNIKDPRVFFDSLRDAGAAIKKSLLAQGKNPRSYIHAMSEFLLKWLDTLGDDSYISVASRYLNKEKTKPPSLVSLHLTQPKSRNPCSHQPMPTSSCQALFSLWTHS